jgi:glycosyltransferase involved in cell wall biosynthesis
VPPRDIDISVIIPFRNAERYLGALLESLAVQEVSDEWEVIAVDNGSSDRSMSIAEQFTSRLHLMAIRAPARSNPSYARNVGVQCSSGRKLMFVDADDELAPGYIAAMSRALETETLVTSRVDSITLNPEWVRGAQGPAWQAEGVDVLYDFMPASGINIGIRRNAYDALGGFSEEFAPCEDVAFSWRARIAGVDLRFVPDAIYRYRYRHTLRGLFWQSASWGRASVLLYREFRQAGMPARSLYQSSLEWRVVTLALHCASGKSACAPLIVRLGLCVGRLYGSVRYRVMFL